MIDVLHTDESLTVRVEGSIRSIPRGIREYPFDGGWMRRWQFYAISIGGMLPPLLTVTLLSSSKPSPDRPFWLSPGPLFVGALATTALLDRFKVLPFPRELQK